MGLSEGRVERLPTLKDRDLELLLPHNWRAGSAIADPTRRRIVELLAQREAKLRTAA